MTSLGLTLKRALLLRRNMVTVLKSSWQKQHPGEGGLTEALGMEVGGGALQSGVVSAREWLSQPWLPFGIPWGVFEILTPLSHPRDSD